MNIRSSNYKIYSLYQCLVLMSVLFLVNGCSILQTESAPTNIADAEVDNFFDARIKLDNYQFSKALFVFDIDNTLLRSDSFVGSEKWVSWYLANREFLTPCVFDIVNISYEFGSMSPTDSHTIDFFTNSSQNKVMILTARDNQQRSVTLRELIRNNLKFNINPPSSSSWSTVIDSKKRSHNVFYENGLMMASGGNKGTALKRYLSSLDSTFSTIVVFDDKKENLDNIKNEMTGQVKQLILIHYAKLDSDNSPLSNEEKKEALEFDKEIKHILSTYFKTRDANIHNNECLY